MARGKLPPRTRAQRKVNARKYPPGLIRGQPAGKHRPYKSKAQARLFFARPGLRRYAIGKAHATGMHSAITKRVGYSRISRVARA